jgi:flagellar motor switch/type III secretory pathway protein FliN
MADTPDPKKVDPVGDLQVPVTAVLAERGFTVDRILELRPGALLDFGRSHQSALDLLVNGSRVARGRAVDVGDRLGFLVETLDARPAGERPASDSGAQRS